MKCTVPVLPVIGSYQRPVTSYQITSYRLPVTGDQRPVTSYRFSVRLIDDELCDSLLNLCVDPCSLFCDRGEAMIEEYPDESTIGSLFPLKFGSNQPLAPGL